MIGPLYEAALVEGGVLELEHASGGVAVSAPSTPSTPSAPPAAPRPGGARAGGRRREAVPVERWFQHVPGDASLLDRCVPPVLDIGSGPGRLTVALARRGLAALGIDVAGPAVDMTRRAGAAALCRDVFAAVPGEGRWRTALLADGNIGIGGDPLTLLRRVHELLAPHGRVLIEVEPGAKLRRGQVRVGNSSWFPWAWLGVEALDDIANEASMEVVWTGSHGARHFTELAVRT